MLKECPVCKWHPIAGDHCQQCGTSLAALMRADEFPQLYYREGLQLLDAGKLDEAIASLAAAAGVESNAQAAVFAALGRAFARKGLYAEAVAYFDRALALDAENDEARRERDAAARERDSRSKQEQGHEASLRRSRMLLRVVPAGALLAGLLLFPLGQRIFSDTENAGVETSAAVVQALQQEIANAGAANLVVVTLDGKGNVRLSGAVTEPLRARLVRSAEEKAGATRVDISDLKATAAAPPPRPVMYTVRSGDSLWRIARRVYGRSELWKLLYEHNREQLRDARRLTIGQQLVVPPAPAK
jgi:tetratricopeptide (TPR) repeat protein